MNIEPIRKNTGQILIFFTLALLVLLAILALVMDGGNVFLNRRSSQNAADAGALAGARTLCLTHDAGQATFMAQQYAIVRNDADQATVGIDSAGYVTVTAQITADTFFAHLIGRPQLTAEAEAVAGCCPPTRGRGVLPIAWACHPPISSALSSSEDCQEQALTMQQIEQYLNNPPPPGTIYPELYVIMNSNSQPDDLADICISGGGWLPCDLDGDGEDDLIANGDRSWLDLNGGGGGSSELVNWINGGFPGELVEHTWMGGQPGVENNVFQAAGGRVGDIVLVPVYDMFCDDYPDPACASLIHSQDIILTSAGGNYFYHIITFAAFYITCVDAPGVPGPECPGHKLATDLGVFPNNTKTIEGYFVTGIIPGAGGGNCGGTDVGAYTLSLYK
jgi:hypothetical protein